MGNEQLRLSDVRRGLRTWLLLLLAVALASCGSVGGASLSSPSAASSPQATPTQVPTPTATPDQAVVQAISAEVSAASPATAVPTVTPQPSPTPMPYVCPYLYGRTERLELQSGAMGEQAEVLVHLPACYADYPDRAFPVLYLFHGWPLDERHWDTLGIDEWSDDWVSRGLAGPFIIVMPGVGSDGLYVNSSGGDYSFEGFVVDELVPAIDAAYRTWRDPAGRAVGGISRGGVWSIEIGMRHQDLFSIVGGHSPALALNRPLPQYDPYRLATEGVSGLRFYLDAGDGDWARAGAIEFRNQLEEVGADVTYDVHTGGHVDDLWRDGLPDYVAFYTKTWPTAYTALPAWISASEDTAN